MNNNLIRFQLRTTEDFYAVRIGLGRFMHILETSNTQYDLGEVNLVLAEVLNNIAEHDGIESLNYPISLKWHTSDGLCINVIDAGRCNLGTQSPTPKCPIWIQKLTICLKAALAGHCWIFCAPKCTPNDADRSIPCASIFQKITLSKESFFRTQISRIAG